MHPFASLVHWSFPASLKAQPFYPSQGRGNQETPLLGPDSTWERRCRVRGDEHFNSIHLSNQIGRITSDGLPPQPAPFFQQRRRSQYGRPSSNRGHHEDSHPRFFQRCTASRTSTVPDIQIGGRFVQNHQPGSWAIALAMATRCRSPAQPVDGPVPSRGKTRPLQNSSTTFQSSLPIQGAA